MIKYLLLLFFFPYLCFAQTPDYELKNPRETMRTFLTNMKRFKEGDAQAISRVLKTMDLTEYDAPSREEIGKSLAIKLVQVFDRIERIDYNKIPESIEKEMWIFTKRTVPTDNGEKVVHIRMTKTKMNNWKFSKDTLASLPLLYDHIRKDKVVRGVIQYSDWKLRLIESLPPSLQKKSFLLYNWQWLGLGVLLILSWILKLIVVNYLINFVGNIFLKAKITILDGALKKFTGPIGIFTLLISWTFGIKLFDLPIGLFSVLYRLGIIAFTICGVVTVYRLVNLVSVYFLGKAKETENKFDDILIPLLAKSINFIVIIVGLVIIGESLTIDMKNIIAGLGIGGLAFAFAAKDTLSNIFGSLTVLLDRPFSVGDAVVIGGNIEGAVEEVGLRSTRIRTWYNSLITVPNGQLTNVHIDNYSRRNARRLRTHLGVQYDTPPAKIEAFCEGIRAIILNHKYTKKENFQVYLNNLGPSSIDILLNVHFEVADINIELQERHRLIMDIIRLAEEMQVDFAFPTQTLHLYKEEHTPKEFLIKQGELPHGVGRALGAKITSSPMTTKSHRTGIKEDVQNGDIGNI